MRCIGVLILTMCALFFRQGSAWNKWVSTPRITRIATQLHSTWSPNQGKMSGNRPASTPSLSQAENYFSTRSDAHNNDEVRTYSNYCIYKGKAALSVKPIPPTFENKSKKSRIIQREGTILFEFAPVGQSPREYNWDAKTLFSMDATECGAFLTFDTSKGVEFTHDPRMGTPEAGQTMKKLSINASPDGKGVFLKLQCNDKEKGRSDSAVMLTWAELEVVKSIMRYSIPFLLGIDRIFEQTNINESA